MNAQRRRRLGLVPVNPNPQPPNASVAQKQANRPHPNQGGVGPGGPGATGGRPHGRHPNNRGNQGNNGNHNGHDNRHGNKPGGGGHKTPTPQPVPPPPTGATTGNPGDPFAIPTYTPGPGQPDPRDQTYYTNVARLLSQAEQGYNQANLQETYNASDYSNAKRNLALSQQQDTQSLAADALRQGLSNSGYLNTQGAQLTGKYIMQGGDLATQNQRSNAALEAAKAALLQGYSNDVAAEWAAAADRYAQTQAQVAQQGSGEPTRHDIKALRRMLHRGGKKGHKHGGHGHHGGHH